MNKLFHCGPVAIQLYAETREWYDRAAEVFRLYTDWGQTQSALQIHIHVGEHDAVMGAGRFLQCVGVNVDKTSDGLAATCYSGAYAFLNVFQQRWDVYMPKRFFNRTVTPTAVDDNLEDLLELAMTTAWRHAGWIPLHAGAVVQSMHCVIVTAPSRGGKTTLTVAMLHRGWKSLGDDKLLVKLATDHCVQAYALQSVFNIDPKTSNWFPEIGDLSQLPLDSVWTPKRRLPIESIWRERMVAHAQPTQLIQLYRHNEHHPIRVEELDTSQVLSALLHQTVVPRDRATARQVLNTVAALASQLRGLKLELGRDAYADPRTLDVIERILE